MAKANLPMKAMILLAINCGLGNSDLKALSQNHLNRKKRLLDYPRNKTGVDRRAVLWPETIDAINDYLKTRKEPRDKEYSHLLFVTKYGKPWGTVGAAGCPITAEFRKLLDETKMYREGLSFYAIRHPPYVSNDRRCNDGPGGDRPDDGA